MSSLCRGLNKSGQHCTRLANRATGYCPFHLPPAPTVQEARELAYESEQASREDIRAQIRSISDLESLKEAQKSVAIAIMDGVIDSKSASAVVQLLKHQADLIMRTSPAESDLTEQQGGTIVERSKKMSDTECFALLQDFNNTITRLTKEAKKTPQLLEPPSDTVEAQEVTEVTDGFGQTSDDNVQRDQGAPEPASDPAEIF